MNDAKLNETSSVKPPEAASAPPVAPEPSIWQQLEANLVERIAQHPDPAGLEQKRQTLAQLVVKVTPKPPSLQ